MLPAGIALAAGAAVGFESAYLLQASEARAVSGALAALARRRRWLFGLALAGVGAVLQVLALRLAPLTVVQPVLALGVVVLVFAGGRLFGEPVGAADLVGAAALAGGVALLTIAGADIERREVHALAAGLALAGLGAVVALAAVIGRPAWLVAGAGAADALAALAAERLSAALDPFALVAVAWAALAAVAVAVSLAVEMRAVRVWPVTRVGPFVLICQTAVPVLLAPIVAGEDWTRRAPLVALGLLLVAAGAWRLAASGGLLERGPD